MFTAIILGDGGHRGTGYVTPIVYNVFWLTLTFHLNVLIGHQRR